MYVMMAMLLATTACIERVGHCFTPPKNNNENVRTFRVLLTMFMLSVFSMFILSVFCRVQTFCVLQKMFILSMFYEKGSYFRDGVVSVSRWVRHIALM